jgi:hypothetical protein
LVKGFTGMLLFSAEERGEWGKEGERVVHIHCKISFLKENHLESGQE